MTDNLQALSVTNIMLDVVPGEDGMGEEVYAKSVADVELVLTALYDKVDLLEEKLAKALEQVELERSLAETMRVQKEDFMKSSDCRLVELNALKDDLANHDSATELMRAWVNTHRCQLPWDKAIEIISVATKMSTEERQRLLDMEDNPVVAWANSKDLESDGYSHSFYVRSEQPGNGFVDGGVPIALYRHPPEKDETKAKQLKSLLKVVSSHPRHPDFAWPDDLYRDVQRELKYD